MGDNWEELLKNARKLESLIEQKLQAYSKFGQSFAQQSSLLDGPPEQSPRANDTLSTSMTLEIENLLVQLSEIIQALRSSAIGTSRAHFLQQHISYLNDYTIEFRKTRKQITETKEHADLLLSVRDDISSYKNQGISTSRGDALLRERGSIASSKNIADNIISQGVEAKEAIAQQNVHLARNTSSLLSVRGTFLSMDAIMGAVKRKKTRDTIILAVVIGLCISFLLWYWLH